MTVIMAWIKQRWSTSLTDRDYPVRWSATLWFKHKASRTRKLGKGADFTPRKSAATSSQPERENYLGSKIWTITFTTRVARQHQYWVHLPHQKVPRELFGAFIPSRERRRCGLFQTRFQLTPISPLSLPSLQVLERDAIAINFCITLIATSARNIPVIGAPPILCFNQFVVVAASWR